jgi:hypothetical protein
MRPVKREEILDYVTYGERRSAIQAEVFAIKARRRVHVGKHLTFLFETTATVRYQIQEMLRAEQIVKEAEIQHEIDTYNELLGGSGELGATLLIEIDDPVARAEKLAAWRDLMAHVYAVLDHGTRVRPRYDPRQVGETRLSSVQYLKFPTGGRVPAAIGVDHPLCAGEQALTPEQQAALAEDLAVDLAPATSS